VALHVEVNAGVALATIDHPPSNLVDGAFFVALLETIAALESDHSVRVLVFRSADPDFCLMHGDVEMLREMAPPYSPVTEPNIAAATFTSLRTGRLVTVGLIDGIARGGGCASWVVVTRNGSWERCRLTVAEVPQRSLGTPVIRSPRARSVML